MNSRLLYQLFESGYERAPDLHALDFGSFSVTFKELRDRALALADLLLAEVGSPRIAVIWCDKSLAFYEAYIACAVLDCTIVPIEANAPIGRVAKVIESIRPGVVLTDRPRFLDTNGVPNSYTVIAVNRGEWHITFRAYDQAFECQDAAYIMFTSGSTGTPKGVPIRGDAVVAYVSSLSDLWSVDSDARFSHTFGVGFDLSVHDMFVAWANSACLCVPVGREGALIQRYVNERGISHWFGVPSAIEVADAMRQLQPAGIPSVRIMAFCGEPLTYEQVDRAERAAPFAEIFNLYGPTEMTIACMQYKVPPRQERISTPNGTVPIGMSLPGVEIELATCEGGSIGNDATWELLARGKQRFDGYINGHPGTRTFVRDRPGDFDDSSEYVSNPGSPADWYRTGDMVSRARGHLVHRGRTDTQVKIRGMRVELGEVEAEVRRIDAIDSAVVVVADGRHGASELVAFFVSSVEYDDLGYLLADALPPYMIPKRFIQIDRMPYNKNGKIDRSTLGRRARRDA